MGGSKDWLKGPNWQGKGSAGGSAAPGSMGPRFNNRLLGWAVLLIPLWFLWTLFYTVQPEERAVVQRFGRVTAIADPGLHFKLPFGIDTIQRVATERVLKQEFGFRSVGQRGDDGRTLYS